MPAFVFRILAVASLIAIFALVVCYFFAPAPSKAFPMLLTVCICCGVSSAHRSSSWCDAPPPLFGRPGWAVLERATNPLCRINPHEKWNVCLAENCARRHRRKTLEMRLLPREYRERVGVLAKNSDGGAGKDTEHSNTIYSQAVAGRLGIMVLWARARGSRKTRTATMDISVYSSTCFTTTPNARSKQQNFYLWHLARKNSLMAAHIESCGVSFECPRGQCVFDSNGYFSAAPKAAPAFISSLWGATRRRWRTEQQQQQQRRLLVALFVRVVAQCV